MGVTVSLRHPSHVSNVSVASRPRLLVFVVSVSRPRLCLLSQFALGCIDELEPPLLLLFSHSNRFLWKAIFSHNFPLSSFQSNECGFSNLFVHINLSSSLHPPIPNSVCIHFHSLCQSSDCLSCILACAIRLSVCIHLLPIPPTALLSAFRCTHLAS
jgi:hypothetical protein